MAKEKPFPPLRACPLCRKFDLLYAGPASSGTEGVECLRCRLRVVRPMPRLFPRDTPKRLHGMKLIEWLRQRARRLVIRTWNRLPRYQP